MVYLDKKLIKGGRIGEGFHPPPKRTTKAKDEKQ